MSRIRWKDPRDGDFNHRPNWRGHAVPGASDSVILRASGAAYTVRTRTNETVKSLDLTANATLAIRGANNDHITFRARQGTGKGENAGVIEVGEFAHFAVGGTVDNSGVIALECHLGVRQRRGSTSLILKRDTTLTGGGSIVLSDNPFNLIRGHGVTLTNVDNTISGSGSIGYDNFFHPRPGIALVNEAKGVIEASGAPGLSIVTDSRVSPKGTVANDGLMEAIDGRLEVVDDSISGQGTILAGAGGAVDLADCALAGETLKATAGGQLFESSNGAIDAVDVGAGSVVGLEGGLLSVTGVVANDGTLALAGAVSVAGAVSGAGAVTLAGGGSARFESSFDQAFTFTGGAGALELAHSQAYGADITGFSASGAASLDLDDIGFVDAGEATYSGNSEFGMLTVADGSHTASIRLIGDYLSSTFTAANDGHGGTIVVATPSGTIAGGAAPSGAETSVARRFVAAMAGLARPAGATIPAFEARSLHAAPLVSPRTESA